MQLAKHFNFSADVEKLAKHEEILKQISHVEASFDEQLPCKKQYNATPNNVNEFMQNHTCSCKLSPIDGILQCQYGCSCDHFRRTCGLDCACEGMCIPNTFLHLPEVDVRLGIAGDELYTEEDVDSGRLAYVFTGKMTSLEKYQKYIRGKQPDLYSIIGRWQGEDGIGKHGVPTFVIDTYQEVAGFINHSCDPNTEVYEIWQNGKLYIVGKTIKYCFRGDMLTFDYNWIYTDDVKYAEICLCGSKNCEAFIAKVPINVMQRSIPRHVGVLNEMETHNILESQRLDNLETTLRNNQTLTSKEKEEVEHLKQDNEELRLTKRKVIYLKKGILMAKTKLIELQTKEKYKYLDEAEFSHLQALPNLDNEMDSLYESITSRASTPTSLASSSLQIDCKGETSKSMENPNELKEESSTSIESPKEYKDETSTFTESPEDPRDETLAFVDCPEEPMDETLAFTKSPEEPKAETWIPIGNSNEIKVDSLAFCRNRRDYCISERRVVQALQNDGIPLSVRVPLPIKDNEQCVLIGVKDINKLLEEFRLSSEKSKNNSSPLQMPKCASMSCLSPPPHSSSSSPRSRKNDQPSSSISHLTQYNLAINPSRIYNTNETFNNDNEEKQDSKGKKRYKLTAIRQMKTWEEIVGLDSIANLSATIKEKKAKDKVEAFNTLNIQDTPINFEDWGEGLFTQDEIKRVYSWIDGTLHARGNNQSQPWSKVKEWTFWLHKNCRHPTLNELKNHGKTWIGISTKTLRAANSGKIVASNTLPLARDVNIILSDVLTFIPFRFSGFTLIESTKSGNIWRLVWNNGHEPLPGNPTFRCAG